MNTHNDFLNNAVDDELGTEGIENLTTDVCSDMHNDAEKMCLSLQNGACGERMSTTSIRPSDRREAVELISEAVDSGAALYKAYAPWNQ